MEASKAALGCFSKTPKKSFVQLVFSQKNSENFVEEFKPWSKVSASDFTLTTVEAELSSWIAKKILKILPTKLKFETFFEKM